MNLVRELGWLFKHDPNLGSLKDYLGNPGEFNHGLYLVYLLK